MCQKDGDKTKEGKYICTVPFKRWLGYVAIKNNETSFRKPLGPCEPTDLSGIVSEGIFGKPFGARAFPTSF